jgi:GNAT superfamily N-acetyltransferase
VTHFVPSFAPAHGFCARARDVEVTGSTNAWVVRGTSDRRWAYAGGDALSLLRRTDTHFAALEPRLADLVARDRTVRWRRGARTFVLPHGTTLPPGPFEVTALTLEDAALVNEHWEHRDEVSLAYVRDCLTRDPALGVRLEGALVGWELVHDDGAMGAAFVLPAFRRRGVMRSLQAALVEALRAKGLPVFKHVSLDNAAWLPAQEPAGWRPVGDFAWLEVE